MHTLAYTPRIHTPPQASAEQQHTTTSTCPPHTHSITHVPHRPRPPRRPQLPRTRDRQTRTGENDTELTAEECPSSFCTSLPVAASQTRTVLSRLPDTTDLPSCKHTEIRQARIKPPQSAHHTDYTTATPTTLPRTSAPTHHTTTHCHHQHKQHHHQHTACQHKYTQTNPTSPLDPPHTPASPATRCTQHAQRHRPRPHHTPRMLLCASKTSARARTRRPQRRAHHTRTPELYHHHQNTHQQPQPKTPTTPMHTLAYTPRIHTPPQASAEQQHNTTSTCPPTHQHNHTRATPTATTPTATASPARSTNSYR